MTDTIERKVADALAGVDEWNQDALDDLEVQLADKGATEEMIAAAVEHVKGIAVVERAKMEKGYRAYLEGGCVDRLH